MAYCQNCADLERKLLAAEKRALGSLEKIEDRCPSCGARSLFIGQGGWLTCSVIGCKDPSVDIAALKARAEKAEANLVERAERFRNKVAEWQDWWRDHWDCSANPGHDGSPEFMALATDLPPEERKD